jgi:hypothetical protein
LEGIRGGVDDEDPSDQGQQLGRQLIDGLIGGKERGDRFREECDSQAGGGGEGQTDEWGDEGEAPSTLEVTCGERGGAPW